MEGEGEVVSHLIEEFNVLGASLAIGGEPDEDNAIVASSV